MMTGLFMFIISFCDFLMLFAPYCLGMGPGGWGLLGVNQRSIRGTVLFKFGVSYVQDLLLPAHQHLNILFLVFSVCMILSSL